MADRKDRRGLGRGLSALMADVNIEAQPGDAKSQAPTGRPDRMVPIENIHPNPEQPRRAFEEGQMNDLTASIREKGVIQPLIVRSVQNRPDHYQIVAGERRWRASQAAKLHELPVIIREFDDTEVLEIAIIENIQRADLNPLEEAAGFRQLMDKFGHTQEKLAEALGKSRSHIANLLRLLSLPQDVQRLLSQGKISAGHARALITADDPSTLARMVAAKGLSVRETEKLAKGGRPKAQAHKPDHQDADTKSLQNDLSANLKMPVSLLHKGDGSGSLTLKYRSLDELDMLCARLTANIMR